MKDSKIIDGNCWVACCDLLGFKKRIYEFEKSGVGYLRAFTNNIFKTVTDAFKRQGKYNSDHVFSTWFSDTFLFFAHGDSKNDFEWVNSSFRIFCWEIISKEWPLRGAIGFGQLYADTSKNIFLGSGIVNAYEYAEKQDWIGTVVTPEAEKRLSELGIDLSNRPMEFTKYPVPFIQEDQNVTSPHTELFVSRLHRKGSEVRTAVETMRDAARGNKYEIKYENTLKFFEQCP